MIYKKKQNQNNFIKQLAALENVYITCGAPSGVQMKCETPSFQ